jgi:membrane protease subunit HflK
MYYETMERVLAKTDKTVIEAPGVMPYLQLPRGGRPVPPPAALAPATGAGR